MAPMPSRRRAPDRRVSAATTSRARTVRPAARVRVPPPGAVAKSATVTPPSIRAQPAATTDRWSVRRIRWLGTSVPSGAPRPPGAKASATGEPPSSTRASRSGALSAAGMRSQTSRSRRLNRFKRANDSVEAA